MNVDKMGPETLREGIRLEYPHYDNFEWIENSLKFVIMGVKDPLVFLC